MSDALIVVDVQRDFCPGGSLAVGGGDVVAAHISEHLMECEDEYAIIIATKDWHPAPGTAGTFPHFSDTPDFKDTWPVHCVQRTAGAQFHPLLDTRRIDTIFLKGRNSAAYSGFEGSTLEDIKLSEYLAVWDVERVFICGLATDYCVRATALDAKENELITFVLSELCAAVDPTTVGETYEHLERSGIAIL